MKDTSRKANHDQTNTAASFTEKLKCWGWLADPKNHASSSVVYKDGTYDGVSVTWHVADFGWCTAQGTTLENAIKSAMTTTFNETEYFPGTV